jgi:hypothetical protein
MTTADKMDLAQPLPARRMTDGISVGATLRAAEANTRALASLARAALAQRDALAVALSNLLTVQLRQQAQLIGTEYDNDGGAGYAAVIALRAAGFRE